MLLDFHMMFYTDHLPSHPDRFSYHNSATTIQANFTQINILIDGEDWQYLDSIDVRAGYKMSKIPV